MSWSARLLASKAVKQANDIQPHYRVEPPPECDLPGCEICHPKTAGLYAGQGCSDVKFSNCTVIDGVFSPVRQPRKPDPSAAELRAIIARWEQRKCPTPPEQQTQGGQ